MSKLADAIRRSQRIEAAPMGLRAPRTPPPPPPLPPLPAPPRRAAPAKGAPAKPRAAAADLPLGAWTPVAGAAAARELRQAGIDFLILEPESTAASVLLDDDLGYVLVLPESPDEPFLRSLESLHLEALYLSPRPWSGPLTVAAQVELSRVHLISRRPLLCEVAPDATADDLQCLRSVGVAALLVASVDGIARLKETIAALPPPPPPPPGRPPPPPPPRPRPPPAAAPTPDRLAG